MLHVSPFITIIASIKPSILYLITILDSASQCWSYHYHTPIFHRLPRKSDSNLILARSVLVSRREQLLL
jgi:hypothetical protein